MIVDRETGAQLEYGHLMKNPKYQDTWKTSYGNEIGRLAQGMPDWVNETNTMFFITKNEIPYRRIICDYWEGKAEPNWTRLAIGGDKINYPKYCSMPTEELLTIKLLLNSIIPTPKAKFMTMDIKNSILTLHSSDTNTFI